MKNNPFWQYSLAVYQRPGVSELCLQLQDDWAADVNVLLCVSWLSSIGQPVTETVLDELLAESYEWTQQCIGPLRQARRYLKQQNDVDVYQQTKTLELEAESLLQQRLYQRLRHLPLEGAVDGLLQSNVQQYLAVLKASEKTQGTLEDWLPSFCGAMEQ